MENIYFFLKKMLTCVMIKYLWSQPLYLIRPFMVFISLYHSLARLSLWADAFLSYLTTKEEGCTSHQEERRQRQMLTVQWESESVFMEY